MALSASGSTGSIAVLNDVVILPVFGGEVATVTLSYVVAGTATINLDLSVDGGTNWYTSGTNGAPYAKLLTTPSANPTVNAFAAVTGNTGQTWEMPIPGNCTHVRAKAAAAGTACTVKLAPFQPYSPFSPITATLVDVTTSSGGSELATGTIMDVTGWSSVSYYFTMSGGTPAFTVKEVDDAGTALASLVTSAVAFAGGWGAGCVLGGTAGTAAATASLPLPRRIQLNSATIAVQTSRIRAEARR